MALKTSFVQHIVCMRPKIVIGKAHDYKCKEEGDFYNIYVRDLDGWPWRLMIQIPIGCENKPSTWNRL